MANVVSDRVIAALPPRTAFKAWVHSELRRPIRCAADFAAELGYSPLRIAKTLLLARGEVGPEGRLREVDRHFVAVVVPAGLRVDLYRVAEALSWQVAALASAHELRVVTGFPSQGVSPLGIGSIPVIVDESFFYQDTILVGGGDVGVEIEISPSMLLVASGALRLRVAVPQPTSAQKGW